MKKRFVPSPAMVVALIALAFASMTPATAAVRKLIGTKNIKDSAITTAKIQKGAVTKDRLAPDIIQSGIKGETGLQGLKGDTGPAGPKGDAGSTGAQGPKGDVGVAGPAGAQATNLFASIDGEVASPNPPIIINQSGVTNASHITLGEYSVTFNRAINACAVVATIKKNPTGIYTDGSLTLRVTNGNTVDVQTVNKSGFPADRDFDVAVFC